VISYRNLKIELQKYDDSKKAYLSYRRSRIAEIIVCSTLLAACIPVIAVGINQNNPLYAVSFLVPLTVSLVFKGTEAERFKIAIDLFNKHS
jgi:hypothetical protein